MTMTRLQDLEAQSRYPSYKPSGHDWLGELPDGWTTKRLKYVSRTRVSNVDKKSEDENVVRLCNYVDVYKNEFIDDTIDLMSATATVRQIEAFQLQQEDVIITKDSEMPDDIGVPAFVTLRDNEDVVCGYHLALITPHKKVLSGRYLFRLLKSKKYRSYFEVSCNGITRFGLDTYSILNVDIVLPSVPEQIAIADFLDRKTALIDDVITRKQKLIELLKEKRQAIITHAVTKGLDSNAKLKPSDIDWLGDIPEGWEVKRLRFVLKLNPSKSEAQSRNSDAEVSFVPMESVSEDGTVNLDKVKPLGEVKDGYTYFLNDDVVVAKITPCFENGKGALMRGLTNGIGFGTTEFHVLRPAGIDRRFLYLLTTTRPFRGLGEAEMKGAAGQKRVPENFIKDFQLGLPSLSEQRRIVASLDRDMAKMDRIVAKLKGQIGLLRENRQALITSAVTGKIKVAE